MGVLNCRRYYGYLHSYSHVPMQDELYKIMPASIGIFHLIFYIKKIGLHGNEASGFYSASVWAR